MHIVHVHIHVKPEYLPAFIDATLANARNSVREAGVARFDVVQQSDAPNHFVLVEVYRSPEEQLRHRETQHYQTWRDTVADMMAEPRTAYKYNNLFPEDPGLVTVEEMPTRFEFATAARIIFGPGILPEIGALATEFGSRALLVTGQAFPDSGLLQEALQAHGLTWVRFAVLQEPTVDLVRQGSEIALAEGCDLVIGFGGGSALDAAKAIAMLATNAGDPLDYLEVIGSGQAFIHPGLPCLAIPTTAGTGAEVTRNAVLASPEHHVKVSLRSQLMLPRLALVDPELTYGLPPAVTASTGFDALTQLIEPFVSARANPLVGSLCRDGLVRVARSLRRVFEDGHDTAARQDMCLASLLGGLALANAGLGAVHGFAGVLGGMFSAPHGALCASLLPYTMAANLRALHSRVPDSPALQRYDEVARVLTGDSHATAFDGVIWVERLSDSLQVPRLKAHGMSSADIPSVVEKAALASSTKANPVKLTPQEMGEILVQAL